MIIGQRFAYCFRDEDDVPVKSGMVLTPAQMMCMAEQGKPIAANMLPDDQFDDGTPDCKFTDLDFVHQRGIDINHVWDLQQTTSKKFHKYSKKRAADQAAQLQNQQQGGE